MDGSNGLDDLEGTSGTPGPWTRTSHLPAETVLTAPTASTDLMARRAITITYERQAKLLLSAIHLSSPNGPPPVFQEAPVALLW